MVIFLLFSWIRLIQKYLMYIGKEGNFSYYIHFFSSFKYSYISISPFVFTHHNNNILTNVYIYIYFAFFFNFPTFTFYYLYYYVIRGRGRCGVYDRCDGRIVHSVHGIYISINPFAVRDS